MSTIKTLKSEVYNEFAKVGKTSKTLIHEIIKREYFKICKNHADLRSIQDWQYVLYMIRQNVFNFSSNTQYDVPAKPANVRKTVTNEQFINASNALKELPNKRVQQVERMVNSDENIAMQQLNKPVQPVKRSVAKTVKPEAKITIPVDEIEVNTGINLIEIRPNVFLVRSC